jgi:hypothetical protein
MPSLSCALKKLQSGGAGGRATRDGGDGSAWWTVHGNDPVEEVPVTTKITGNRLIDVEELAAVGTLSYSSTSSTRTEATLDDFVAYLQENGAIDGIIVQQHLQNWKEGRGKELLDSKKEGNEEKRGINYKTGVRNDEDETDERPSKRIRLKKKVCKMPCVRCGRWDHTKRCKSCPQSKDYPPDHDVLYEDWETDKRSKGEIPDINGEEEQH